MSRTDRRHESQVCFNCGLDVPNRRGHFLLMRSQRSSKDSSWYSRSGRKVGLCHCRPSQIFQSRRRW
eukprot:6441318-Amphidinium_carterae.1